MTDTATAEFIATTTAILERIAGIPLPGGCPDCLATQTVHVVAPEIYSVSVQNHDDTCPAISGVTT